MIIRIVWFVGVVLAGGLTFQTPQATYSVTTPFEARSVVRDVVTVIPNTMVWPFPETTISSHYGERDLLGLGFHYGLDFGVDWDTPIPAVAEGTVVFVGWYYGNEVRILDPSGRYLYRYAHLSDFNVGVGEYVPMGHQIGLVGSTGFSTGPHLHLEVLDNGVPIDPYLLLKEYGYVKYK
jgi:murein DD-endopeptidase MepM/ murein hydrolase activator NlpD